MALHISRRFVAKANRNSSCPPHRASRSRQQHRAVMPRRNLAPKLAAPERVARTFHEHVVGSPSRQHDGSPVVMRKIFASPPRLGSALFGGPHNRGLPLNECPRKCARCAVRLKVSPKVAVKPDRPKVCAPWVSRQLAPRPGCLSRAGNRSRPTSAVPRHHFSGRAGPYRPSPASQPAGVVEDSSPVRRRKSFGLR
jgi:hypothetical protein